MTAARPTHPEGPRPERPEQTALVARLQTGDSEAYAELIRTHGGRLLQVARRLLGSEEDARDCVQETFLQAFRRIDTFEGRSHLGTWLYRIAVNVALMRLRSASARPEAPMEELLPTFDHRGSRVEPALHPVVGVDEIVARRQTGEIVIAKIRELPYDHRVVLVLRDVEELSTREVAELLEVSENVVKVRLHRARVALKRLLAPVFEGRSP